MYPQGEVLGDPQDLAALDEPLIESRLCLQRMTPARVTLEIGELHHHQLAPGLPLYGSPSTVKPGRIRSGARVSGFAQVGTRVSRAVLASGGSVPASRASIQAMKIHRLSPGERGRLAACPLDELERGSAR